MFLAVTGTFYVAMAIVMVLGLVGVAYGYFTREGSGIASHRIDDRDGSPGAVGHTESSGRDEGDGDAFATHGTQ